MRENERERDKERRCRKKAYKFLSLLALFQYFSPRFLYDEWRGEEKKPRKFSFIYFRIAGKFLGQKRLYSKSWKEREEERQPEPQRYLGEVSKGEIRKEAQLLGYLAGTFHGGRGRESVRCFAQCPAIYYSFVMFQESYTLVSKRSK